jgi:flagellar hook protein FlgE
MSLNGAMLSGVSSLIANSAALGAISDNISNVNTVGYKQTDTQFQDLISAQASEGLYNSGGVQADITNLVSQQGQFQQTSTPTNMAIDGAGMFVVSQTDAGITSTSGAMFTRAGDFTANSSGYLVNSAGLFLQGWVANSAGVITPNPSQISALAPINVDSISNAPNPSTTASLSANLNSDLYTPGTASTAVETATYDPTSATTSMAAYDASGGATGTQPDYSSQMTVYDAQGGAHTIELDFLKTTTANVWNVEVNVVPASDVDQTQDPNGTLASGTVTFNSDGTFNSTSLNTTATPSTAAAGQLSLSIPWAASTGLGTQTLSLNLNSANGGLTQYAAASTTNSDTVDGGPTSAVAGVSVTSQGYVEATFANGTTQKIAQVALATFQNEDGLESASGDAFSQTAASGNFTLDSPEQGSAGSIQGSALESSTVDLSTEFTNLITTQNAYSAASKIITTADQMMQTLDQVITG